MGAWIVVAAVGVPLLVVLAWKLLDESLVRIEPGQLGLVLANGRPTDRALQPGLRWVPMLRRMSVQVYPSNQLSYRAGAASGEIQGDELERSGPPLRATLGDRAEVSVSYTVRFRLDPARLRTVHERFGPAGLWSVVRDVTGRTVRSALNEPEVEIADLFGDRRQALEDRLGAAVAADLAAEGFEVTSFAFTDVDLGRTGAIVQAIVRARLELEREQAEAALRAERARSDAELQPLLSGPSLEAALRYRETDVWRDLAQALTERPVVLPAPGRRPVPEPAPAAPDEEGQPAARAPEEPA